MTTTTKTKDNTTIYVDTSIQYHVDKEKADKAFFKLTNVKQQLNSYVDNVVMSQIPLLNLDECYEQKNSLADAIKDQLAGGDTSVFSSYGLVLEKVLMTDLRIDPSVMQAMNSINAQKRQRVAAIDKAEAQKIGLVTAAEAEAESKYLAGTGLAKMRVAITKGFKESIDHMTHSGGLNSEEVVHMMLVSQYLDVMKDFANNTSSKSILVPHTPGGLTDVESQLKVGFAAAKK